MRLGDFITHEMESILARWEEFAATLIPAALHLGSLELRDHAHQILQAIVQDLATPQTAAEQHAKSWGRAPFAAGETAAQTHAVLRAKGGFDIKQLASEYRALRASVLSLWLTGPHRPPEPAEDMIRFNEAIDQALAESIGHFHAEVERSRNLLLGMLGHDMRSPLQTIQMTAAHLARLNTGEPVSSAARRLVESGARMQRLLDDLVDFNRMSLGIGIRVRRAKVSLAQLCAEELDQIRAAHPDARLELTVSGDCSGDWDAGRLEQVVRNLVVNAITHGGARRVQVELTDAGSSVNLEVRNPGASLDTDTLRSMFAPLHSGAEHGHDGGGLGLGLFIVQEIVRAHGGSVDAVANDSETLFTVRLPKKQAAASKPESDTAS